MKTELRDRNLTIGRQMYRANDTRSTFHDENGNEVTKDVEAEAMLWRNRESIWGTPPPPSPPGAAAILDEYFHESRSSIPPTPHIGERKLRGLVLACRGSAPGVDGIPYELYHWGAFFVAALLAQGL